MKTVSLLLLLAVLQVGNAQNSSARVLGIGIGTLIIIIAVIFSIIWCLACRNSSKPEIYSIIGLLVPAVLILAFALTPKQSQRQTTSGITDGNFVPHIVFMVLSLLGFLIPGVYMLINDAFNYKKAKNVARAAFIRKEEKEEQEEPLAEPSRSQLQLESHDHTEQMEA